MLTRLVILSSLFAGALASPTGASSCDGGKSAVDGPHLSAPLQKTGSLEEGSLVFAINGVPLVPDTPMDIPIGVSHTWSLSVDMGGLQARPFKGFLVRLDGAGVGVEDALLAISRSDGMVQSAAACASFDGVGGVTHTDNAEKSCVSGALMLDEAMDGMAFDITVVIENTKEGKSAHFWSPYTINAVTSGSDDMAMMDGLGCSVATSVPSSGETMTMTGAETSEGTLAK